MSAGPSVEARDVVAALVRALDADDFVAAGALIDDECEYDTGAEVIRGADAVIAPYRENAHKARSRLDALEYASTIEGTEGRSTTVLFADHLTHRGARHTFRCRQVFGVNDRGRVDRIEHREIDGERAALNEFFERVGISWE